MAILSRRQIPLDILLYEQFMQFTLITLHPNIKLYSNQQHAYQSFFESLPRFIPFAILWHTESNVDIYKC